MVYLGGRQLFAALLYLVAVDAACKPKSHAQQKPSDRKAFLKPVSRAALLTLGTESSGACTGAKSGWKHGDSSSSTFHKVTLAEKFQLFNNVFAATDAGPDSFQNIQCLNYSSGTLSWETAFEYKSAAPDKDTNVKSYSNAAVFPKPTIKISQLKEFSSVWSWTMKNRTEDLVADVSYDIFTSLQPDCPGQGPCASHELMIWPAAIGGARPAGSKVGEGLVVGNFKFDVYKGEVGGTPVLSIIPSDPDKQQYFDFSADFKTLLQVSLKPYGLSGDEYICSVGSGVEPFKGGGAVHTTAYQVNLS